MVLRKPGAATAITFGMAVGVLATAGFAAASAAEDAWPYPGYREFLDDSQSLGAMFGTIGYTNGDGLADLPDYLCEDHTFLFLPGMHCDGGQIGNADTPAEFQTHTTMDYAVPLFFRVHEEVVSSTGDLPPVGAVHDFSIIGFIPVLGVNLSVLSHEQFVDPENGFLDRISLFGSLHHVLLVNDAGIHSLIMSGYPDLEFTLPLLDVAF